MKKQLTIISGGQTGVDRAALDFAIQYSIRYGGWCPKGGLAEDLPTPPGLLKHYPELRETPESDYYTRTRLNVEDSDATLVLADKPELITTGGTGYTVRYAKAINKPHHTVVIRKGKEPDDTVKWLREITESSQALLVLNIAGPRESKSSGVYEQSYVFLEKLLKNKEFD